jgi:hypothetical protein
VKASTELVRAVTAFTAQPPPGQTGVPAEQSRKFDVREYEEAAMALAGAAGEVQRMLVEVRALIEANRDTGTAKDAEGFDIREYRATAEAIDRGAAGIRGIMGDVCTLTPPLRLPRKNAQAQAFCSCTCRRNALYSPGFSLLRRESREVGPEA